MQSRAATVEVVPWAARIVPIIYTAADTLADREFPPDTLRTTARDRASASWAARTPQLDGDLGDWRLVRWFDLAGPRAFVQGAWVHDADLSLRFALQHDGDGLWFGATLRDDQPATSRSPVLERETVTLTLAAASPVVQHYWMGSSRSIRVRIDGAVDGWTYLRNRRREPFDAAALGVQARVQRDSAAGRAVFEVFVPWTVLYPLLPRTDSRALVNVLVDDFDAGVLKRAAWSTAATSPAAPRPQWAALDFREAPGGAGWLAITPGPYAESGLEWLVVPPAGHVAGPTLRCSGPGGGEFLNLRSKAISGPTFLRVRGWNPPAGTAPASRHVTARLEWDRTAAVEREVRTAPTLSALRAAFAAACVAARADTTTAFPNAADAAAHLRRAAQLASGIGDWADRKFHATGVTAYRQAAWSAVDAAWSDAVVFDAARRGDAEAGAALARRWPGRRGHGVPAGEIVQRGYVCTLDATVQTYTVYVPARVTHDAPLVLALHDLDGDERTLFETSALAPLCEQHGVIAVCPGGRGNSGYWLAGERDVLDVLAAAQRTLPVDGRRLAVTGMGLGGTGTWTLALRHPQLFAAACGVSGYADLDQGDIFTRLGYQPAEREWFNKHNPVRLVRGGATTAYRIVHGDHDAAVSPVHARILDDKMNELKVPHELHWVAGGDHGMRLFDADLDANLAFLTAHARAAPGVAESSWFAARGGPLCDAFVRGPFVIVFGTRDAPRAASGADSATAAATGADSTTAWQLAAEWNSRYGGFPPVVADRDVTPEMRSQTLVLVGTPATHALLAQWSAQLPLRWEDDAVIVGGKAYRYGKYGVAVALPHPESPHASLVVCSALRNRVGTAARSLFTAAAALYVTGASPLEILPLE